MYKHCVFKKCITFIILKPYSEQTFTLQPKNSIAKNTTDLNTVTARA